MAKIRNNKWLVFLGVALVAVMINMDITIVNIAVATIAKDFHTSLAQMQWLIGIYMLTSIIFIIFAGKLADIFSRKPVYLIGIGFFLAGSTVAGLALNQWMLILARAIQGIGFAFTLSLGIVIITSIFPLNKRGFVLGCYMTVAGASQALGPTIGGVILQYMSWRWLFLLNIPLALFAILIITIFYQHNHDHKNKEPLNLLSVTLLALVLSVFIFSFTEVGTWGLYSWQFITLLLFGIFATIIFYQHEKNCDSPIIHFELFHDRNYLAINCIRFIYMYSWITILFCIPLYLQNILGIIPLYAGLIIFCMTIMLALFSPLVGIWLDRIGFVRPIIVSVLLSLTSLLLLANLPTLSPLPVLITALVIFGLASPIMGSGSAWVALNSLPANRAGVGMGTFYTIALLGSTMGVAIAGSVLSIVSTHHLLNIIKTAHYHFTAIKLVKLHQAASGASSIHNFAAKLKPYIVSSFRAGLTTVMWINAIATLLSLGICCFLKTKNKT